MVLRTVDYVKMRQTWLIWDSVTGYYIIVNVVKHVRSAGSFLIRSIRIPVNCSVLLLLPTN